MVTNRPRKSHTDPMYILTNELKHKDLTKTMVLSNYLKLKKTANAPESVKVDDGRTRARGTLKAGAKSTNLRLQCGIIYEQLQLLDFNFTQKTLLTHLKIALLQGYDEDCDRATCEICNPT